MSPSRYPSSNLALLKRIAKGKGLWRVNPIVDLGNAISIAYALPLGAHAVDKSDVLELRFSHNDDTFVALGEQEVDPTLAPGELVYAVGTKVQTRRWTWRQSECGKVDAGASRILFPLDGFIGCNDGVVRQACYELASYLHKYFGAQTEVYLTGRDVSMHINGCTSSFHAIFSASWEQHHRVFRPHLTPQDSMRYRERLH